MKERLSNGRFKRKVSDNNYNGLAIYYDKKGYATVWLNGRDRKVHVLEWEKHNGEKPQGFEIHHKDENKWNWDINNLELLSNSDHQRVHAGWVKENGEWTKKPCKDCKQLLPLDNFYQRKGLTPSNRCIECSSIYFKSIRTPEFVEKKKKYLKEYYQKRKQCAY